MRRAAIILNSISGSQISSTHHSIGTFDVVTANGIFYLLGEQAWPMMQQIIERLYELATSAVAFNSLSAWANKEEQEAGEYYADPIKVVDFCRRLTPWVVLRHDYHPRDFTIYMYKTGRP